MIQISNIDISVWIRNKYKNPIIPIIPDLISAYLIHNPAKIDYYFNPNIRIEDLIYHLAKVFQFNKDIDLLGEIKSFIEGNNETRI